MVVVTDASVKGTLGGAYRSQCLCMDFVFRQDMIPLTVLQTLLVPHL